MYIIDVNMSVSFRATPSPKKMHHPAKRLTGVDFLKATVDAKSGKRRITHRATQISANPSTSSSSCKTLPNKYNVSVSNTISLMVWFHVIPIISPNPPPFPVLQQFARSLHRRGTPTLQHLGLLSPRWIVVKKKLVEIKNAFQTWKAINDKFQSYL